MAEIDVTDLVGFLTARLCHAHRNYVNTKLAQLDLHVGQEMFLLRLGEREGIMQSDLADHLCVQQATVTRMVDRLEKANLVERSKDAADQRVSRLSLTEQGRSLLDPLAELWREVDLQMLQGFTTEERILLRRMLLQVYDNLTR